MINTDWLNLFCVLPRGHGMKKWEDDFIGTVPACKHEDLPEFESQALV